MQLTTFWESIKSLFQNIAMPTSNAREVGFFILIARVFF